MSEREREIRFIEWEGGEGKRDHLMPSLKNNLRFPLRINRGSCVRGQGQ